MISLLSFRHERVKHPNEDIPMEQSSENQQEDTQSQEDCMKNYHIARLRFGLVDLDLRDAIKEGDGTRLLVTLPYLLMLFHLYKRTKYAYVTLLHLVKAFALLPESLANELVHDRFWNTKGGAGNNIPLLDLRMEHMVRLFKLSLKQLGANIDSKGAQRIAQSLGHVEELINNIDNDVQITRRSGYHSSKHLRETVQSITRDLTEVGAFENQPGREYPSFKGFQRNITSKLDFYEYYGWMDRLLKIWTAVYES